MRQRVERSPHSVTQSFSVCSLAPAARLARRQERPKPRPRPRGSRPRASAPPPGNGSSGGPAPTCVMQRCKQQFPSGAWQPDMVRTRGTTVSSLHTALRPALHTVYRGQATVQSGGARGIPGAERTGREAGSGRASLVGRGLSVAARQGGVANEAGGGAKRASLRDPQARRAPRGRDHPGGGRGLGGP